MKYKIRVDLQFIKPEVLEYFTANCEKIQQDLYLITGDDLFNIAYNNKIQSVNLMHDQNENEYYISATYCGQLAFWQTDCAQPFNDYDEDIEDDQAKFIDLIDY